MGRQVGLREPSEDRPPGRPELNPAVVGPSRTARDGFLVEDDPAVPISRGSGGPSMAPGPIRARTARCGPATGEPTGSPVRGDPPVQGVPDRAAGGLREPSQDRPPGRPQLNPVVGEASYQGHFGLRERGQSGRPDWTQHPRPRRGSGGCGIFWSAGCGPATGKRSERVAGSGRCAGLGCPDRARSGLREPSEDHPSGRPELNPAVVRPSCTVGDGFLVEDNPAVPIDEAVE